MSAKKNKPKPKNTPKSRKQLRKEQRKNKKAKRHEYYTNRGKQQRSLGQEDESRGKNDSENKKLPGRQLSKANRVEVPKTVSVEKIREKDKKEQQKLQKEMNKQRSRQLLQANMEEDRNIKRLEKQLKLNKRKSKTVPKSFSSDGLDYLLELCDSENLGKSAMGEQQLTEVNDEFEEDLALVTGGDDELDMPENEVSSDQDSSDGETGRKAKKIKLDENSDDSSDNESVDSVSCDDEEETTEGAKRVKLDENSDDSSDNESVGSVSCDDEEETAQDTTWEDIYGRLRSQDGSVIKKYIPPAARMSVDDTNVRLKRQLKGLFNRLAESNMHSIATQIEELYMNNSRHDMNNTITNIITEALITHIIAPERLLMEHILLVAILHANVGSEVGAHFLQTMVKEFQASLTVKDTENKKLDNVVIILAQLYNFKLFDCKLIHEVLDKLAEDFDEKSIECILHILRNVGFNLRKDDPLSLKNLIMNLQKRAASTSADLKDSSRVKFMLDVLLAIKNNNVSKIPNYDTSYSEHLKKIMKGFIRKGNYVTQLNISLDDLLNADMKGKWWVVGSAWTGNDKDNKLSSVDVPATNTYSKQLLELAAQQRMNTDARKNIFCIIMSAEDYLDAFEKLLRLELKNQQEREIIHVLLHCCLKEKKYNPYYAVLALKFCEHDRKYQMIIKYSIWDKLKALKDQRSIHISNLARLLTFLFLEKGLPISTLKIVQFTELDKTTLRFMRQILLGILLHDDLESCRGVFEKVSQSAKLKMFNESLKLFIHHFLLKNLGSQAIADDKRELLRTRVKIVDKLLSIKR